LFEHWTQEQRDYFGAITLPQSGSNGATSEDATQKLVVMEAPKFSAILWRNNNGVMEKDGRWIRFGLGNTSKKLNENFKSSDLIGIKAPGVFIAIETKKPGWTKPETARDRAQHNYLMCVAYYGGIAGFVSHVDDFKILMRAT